MSSLTVHILNSQEILAHQESWNGLWERSPTSLPTSRAEFLPLWTNRFAPGNELQAIVVSDHHRWVAALPMIGRRWIKIVKAGSVPRNDWLLAGNLLVDTSAAVTPALRKLAQTLNQLPWTLYRFSHIPSHETCWQQLREALLDEGFRIECRPSHDVSLIPVDTDWETFTRRWSKNHRKNMARTMRRLQEQGTVQVRRYVPTQVEEAAGLLSQAFQIEDSGWKREAGGSVLQTPGMSQFLHKLAELLIPRRELELSFLEIEGRPLAFEWLWNAKGVIHSYKVGYDELYEKWNPGQILMQELLRELFESRRCQAYDCVGPASPATEKWCGERYRMSQWTVAPRRRWSRALLFAYQQYGRARPLELCREAESREPAARTASHSEENTTCDPRQVTSDTLPERS